MFAEILHAPLTAIRTIRRDMREGHQLEATRRAKGLCQTCGKPSPEEDECGRCWNEGRAL